MTAITRLDRERILKDNIHGIGDKKATAIVEEFQEIDNVANLSDAVDFAKRMDAIGISATLIGEITRFCTTMKKQSAEQKFLTDNGMSRYQAASLTASPETYQGFLNNPYKIGQLQNIPFDICDKIAHLHKGVDLSDERMKYMIPYILTWLEGKGHTWSSLENVANLLNSYQRRHEYSPQNFDPYSLLIFLPVLEDVVIEKRSDSLTDVRLFNRSTYELETALADLILKFSKTKPTFEETATVDDIQKIIRFNLDQNQRQAISSASQSGLKIITGPPGSGKTAVVNGIIKYVQANNPDAVITLCAPTGRAAKHMTEVSGIPSMTIHKLLGLSQYKQFVADDTKLDADVLICDEASMLSLELAFYLLSSLKDDATIYFVGDKDQLSAVGAGNVLHDTIQSGIIPVFILDKVYRQDGIILENAQKINHGETALKEDASCSLKRHQKPNDALEEVLDLYKQYYDEKDPFSCQILAPSYGGECGIDEINRRIQDMNPAPFLIAKEGHWFKRNDKILMIKNDTNGLYQNGSIGTLVSMEGMNPIVDFEGEETVLPAGAVADMKLGYAMSVHKSQGSEYNTVILCLMPDMGQLLKRNVVYTGVTRAKKTLYIEDVGNSLSKAIKNNEVSFMQTSLKEKLQNV